MDARSYSSTRRSLRPPLTCDRHYHLRRHQRQRRLAPLTAARYRHARG
jgi:hypothetical protein